ncbi:MAG: hypothetical protein V7752_20340 [Halopseudomonas sp.]
MKGSIIRTAKTSAATLGVLTAIWFASPAFAQVGVSLVEEAGNMIQNSGLGMHKRVQQYHCATTNN